LSKLVLSFILSKLNLLLLKRDVINVMFSDRNIVKTLTKTLTEESIAIKRIFISAIVRVITHDSTQQTEFVVLKT
jgi:hypothetical protein